MDDWIVGEAPTSGRQYVVHAAHPRFIVEILEANEGGGRFGALTWIDDPGAADAAHWSRTAAETWRLAQATRRTRYA